MSEMNDPLLGRSVPRSGRAPIPINRSTFERSATLSFFGRSPFGKSPQLARTYSGSFGLGGRAPVREETPDTMQDEILHDMLHAADPEALERVLHESPPVDEAEAEAETHTTVSSINAEDYITPPLDRANSIHVLTADINGDTKDDLRPRGASAVRKRAMSRRVINSTHHTKGVFWTTFNLVNDVVSGGIVTMPYMFEEGGIVNTLIIMIFYGLLNGYTLKLVHRMVRDNGFHNIADMSNRALGRPGFILALVCVFVFNWGSLISALLVAVTVAQTFLTTWFGNHELFGRSWILFFMVVLCSPIAYFKSLARFSLSALINQVLLFAVIIIVVVKMCMVAAEGGVTVTTSEIVTFKPGVLSAIGGISYQYACHDIAFHVVDSLENSTSRRFGYVAWCSMFAMFILGSLLGILGVLFLPGNQNIVDSFPNSDLVINITRCALTVAVAVGIPYTIFMPRVAVLAVLQLFAPEWTIKAPAKPNNRLKRNIVHVIVTSVLLGGALGVSIAVQSLGITVEIIGAVSGVAIALILPSICYLRLSSQKFYKGENLFVSFVFVVGVFSMIGCVVSIIMGF